MADTPGKPSPSMSMDVNPEATLGQVPAMGSAIVVPIRNAVVGSVQDAPGEELLKVTVAPTFGRAALSKSESGKP